MFSLNDLEKRRLKYILGGVLIALVGIASLCILTLLPPIFGVAALAATAGGLLGWLISLDV